MSHKHPLTVAAQLDNEAHKIMRSHRRKLSEEIRITQALLNQLTAEAKIDENRNQQPTHTKKL